MKTLIILTVPDVAQVDYRFMRLSSSRCSLISSLSTCWTSGRRRSSSEPACYPFPSTLSLGFPLSVELATLSYTKTRSFLACFRCVDGSAVIGPLQKRKPPESRLLIKIEALSSRRTVGVSLYPLLAGPQTFSEYDSSFETANCTLFRFPFRRLPLIFVYLANRRPPFRCTPGE